MSLRVWLPLNGDLKNQGLSEVAVTVSGTTTFSDNGKIGKCLSANGSSYWTISPLTLGTTASMSWWANSTDTSAMLWVLGASVYAHLNFWQYNGKYYLNTGNSLSNPFQNNDSDVSAITDGKWHHYTTTFDGISCLLYIDGAYYAKSKTYKSPATANNSNIRLCGGFGNGHSYDTQGLINDFRIYDHVLSPAEVKEISRGLVLHYKLDHLPINNLIPFNLSNDTYTIMDYANRTTGSISNKIYHVDGYQSDTSADTSFSIKSNTFLTLNADSDYYLSFYCKAANSISTLYFGVSGQAYTGLMDSSNKHFYPSSPVNLGNNYEGYVVLKIHTGSDTQYKINIGFDVPNLFGIGSYMEFSNIMLTSSEPDLESTYFDNTILDSSGYNNHGTIIGTSTIYTDSPRYTNTIKYTTSACSILVGNLSTLAPQKEFTFSIWFKKISNEWSSKRWETIFGGPSGFEFQSKRGSTNSPVLVAYSWGQSGSGGQTYSLDTWNMVTMVRNANACKFYLNGELYYTGSAGSIPSGNYYIGSWSNASSQNYRGCFSDARIYTTTLSEEDVRQLYEVSGKIDNFGNLHSYKFEEYNIGRELLVGKNFVYYSNGSFWNNFSNEGMKFQVGDSLKSGYIEINPEGHKYIYDFTISVSDGNQFYIGFERYDENKTARSNDACTYVYSNKPGSDLVKRRYTGTVNLSTDGVNPCKYIRLRILNGWSGSDSDSTKLATVHRWSLREIPTSTDSKTKLLKQGVLKTDMLREGNTRTKIEKNLVTYVNEFIEI